eukprot:gene8628-575_t
MKILLLVLVVVVVAKNLKLGVVGYSRELFDKQEANDAIKDLIPKMINFHQPNSIELVSGLTNQGVPKLSYIYAVQKGFKTVGIAPTAAFKVPSGLFPVDKRIIVGKEFGDESEYFINYIDILVRVGGGQQSRREVAMFKKKLNFRNLEKYLMEKEITWHGNFTKK